MTLPITSSDNFKGSVVEVKKLYSYNFCVPSCTAFVTGFDSQLFISDSSPLGTFDEIRSAPLGFMFLIVANILKVVIIC
jgi:hypothetical protein